MNQVSLEKIIQLVTQEVVAQLKKNAVVVNINSAELGANIANSFSQQGKCIQTKTERIDMGKYKTPVLTERHINKLHELTGKIIIPCGTIITPKAREIVKRKQIVIETE
ncbi:MAG: hypothetical protein JEZ07_02725 [Phycisphaerae bacterium]|nr:hypothetical protein [Phycisphaerae bacterium]